mgnify:CR=1 FL=1
MKICENGNVRNLTPEEIAALEAQATEQPAPTPTIEERVESLENTSDDVILMIAELIGGEQ